MSVTRIEHNGHVVVSEFVTDGAATWLESVVFIGYSEHEAEREYAHSLEDRELSLADHVTEETTTRLAQFPVRAPEHPKGGEHNGPNADQRPA